MTTTLDREEVLADLNARDTALDGSLEPQEDVEHTCDGITYWSERATTAERELAEAREYIGRMSTSPGSFDLAADVKAVRGKNTSDGPALEVLLDASIHGHVADLMSLIGKSFTRVIFKPYVIQERLPEPPTDASSDNATSEETHESEPEAPTTP